MIMHHFRTNPPSVLSSDRQAGEETKTNKAVSNTQDSVFEPEGY